MIAKTGEVRVILGISVYLLGVTGCGVWGNQHSEKPAVKQTAPPSRAQGPQNYSSLTAEQWVNLSVAYYQDAKYLEAIAAAQTAVYLKPDYAEAYNNMGAAYGA